MLFMSNETTMAAPKRKLIFTITSGRSGTAYLAELLRSNGPAGAYHHEILGWDHFGVDTPDLSHMTTFNSKGNTANVRDFWRRKFNRVASGAGEVYCETSHVLAKCGLIENLDLLDVSYEVHVVALRRDTLATALSLRRRGDFLNYGNMWLWYLDPRYPKNITALRGGITASNLCVWYVVEMLARAEYYRLLLRGVPNVTLHRATLEDIAQLRGAKELLDALGIVTPTSRIVIPAAQNEGISIFPVSKGDETMLSSATQAATQADIVGLARHAYEAGFRFEVG